MIGSILEARRAGIAQANPDTKPRRTVPAKIMTGSRGFPRAHFAMIWFRASERATPAKIPAPMVPNTDLNTIRSKSPAVLLIPNGECDFDPQVNSAAAVNAAITRHSAQAIGPAPTGGVLLKDDAGRLNPMFLRPFSPAKSQNTRPAQQDVRIIRRPAHRNFPISAHDCSAVEILLILNRQLPIYSVLVDLKSSRICGGLIDESATQIGSWGSFVGESEQGILTRCLLRLLGT